MAIPDLLWACPACAVPGGIRADGSCGCGAVFRRGEGASIELVMPDGRVTSRSPADWVDRLPEPAALLERDREGEGGSIHQAQVVAREQIGSAALRSGGRYLNQVERYGPRTAATLELHRDRLVYRPDGGEARQWPLETLTAVQTSSSTLQIRIRDQPLISLRFVDASLFLWEMLLHAALRAFYRRTGRGEIAEFQPRIVTNP